jgi:hypothetical protein
MLLAHVYKRKEFAYLPEPPCYGVAPSLKEVIAYAGKHGLTLRGYKVSEKARFVLPKKKPVLALIEEDGLSHEELRKCSSSPKGALKSSGNALRLRKEQSSGYELRL